MRLTAVLEVGEILCKYPGLVRGSERQNNNMISSEQTLAALRIVILGNASPNGSYARDCLETLGVAAGHAASPAELFEALRTSQLDLVILDGDDPAALQTVQTLKGTAASMLVPVLAVCTTDDQARAAFTAGADEQITRAAGPRSLLALIEVLLEQSDVRRQVAATMLARDRQLRVRIRSTLCRYLSPPLSDRILAEIDVQGGPVSRHNTSTRAAVMFADMRGFTSMAERLAPADTLQVLNEYFSLLTEIAFRHDGTIFNMSGDSLMIGYGVPVESRDSTSRAIDTAAEMLRGFRHLAQDWQERHDIHVGLGIGINDGEVLAGDVGSLQYMSYTMIGDTVNVAARLAQRARAGEMLFSGSVKRSLDERGHDIGAVPLPPLMLRGRSTPLDIFCVPQSERQLVDG